MNWHRLLSKNLVVLVLLWCNVVGVLSSSWLSVAVRCITTAALALSAFWNTPTSTKESTMEATKPGSESSYSSLFVRFSRCPTDDSTEELHGVACMDQAVNHCHSDGSSCRPCLHNSYYTTTTPTASTVSQGIWLCSPGWLVVKALKLKVPFS